MQPKFDSPEPEEEMIHVAVRFQSVYTNHSSIKVTCVHKGQGARFELSFIELSIKPDQSITCLFSKHTKSSIQSQPADRVIQVILTIHDSCTRPITPIHYRVIQHRRNAAC